MALCLTCLLEFHEYVTSLLDSGKPVDIICLDFQKTFHKVPQWGKGTDFLGGLLQNADSVSKYFASIATDVSYSVDNVLKYKCY